MWRKMRMRTCQRSFIALRPSSSISGSSQHEQEHADRTAPEGLRCYDAILQRARQEVQQTPSSHVIYSFEKKTQLLKTLQCLHSAAFSPVTHSSVSSQAP
ncbi:uncharacterized protein V6R79_020075 [Siganus canaliculatus]